MLVQRKRIKEFGTSLTVDVLTEHRFVPENIEKYKYMFKACKAKSMLFAQSFEDIKWTIPDPIGIHLHLKFDLEVYQEINTALKCFVLLKIEAKLKNESIKMQYGYLRQACIVSRGFSPEYLPELEELILDSGYGKKSHLSRVVVDFLQFYQREHCTKFIELCSQYTHMKSRVRDLPKYQDILMFDYLLNDYFEKCSKEARAMYFPIFLWWRITTIVPMRIQEFLLLKRDCVEERDDSTYWLTLPRSKQKNQANDPRFVEVTDTVQINKEIYDLVKEFIFLSKQYGESNFLCPYTTYVALTKPRFTNDYHLAEDRMSKRNYRTLLDQFYKDIIVGKYGFHGDKVLPGDTRHLAFCNMMLQGWNMLSIARMGGHTSIRTQMHYHAHLDYFAESWVYNLSQRYRLDRINRAATIPTFSVHKVLAKNELFQPTDFEQRYEVDHGFCTYNPSLCETGDCRFCEHYLFSPNTESHEEAIRWLTNSSNELQRRMREQIDYLKEISKHIYYDVFTLEVQKTGQERLLNAANQLRRIMEQKAMVDSYLEE